MISLVYKLDDLDLISMQKLENITGQGDRVFQILYYLSKSFFSFTLLFFLTGN